MNRFDPADLRRLRLYVEAFGKSRPEIFEFFPGGANPLFPFPATSDRGLGILLLLASLYRPGGETWSTQVVAGLYRAVGPDIFKLNRLPFPSLQKTLSTLPRWPDAEEQRRVPGILRSVCDFFYAVGGLGKWLEESQDWELRTRELCEAIFWMGKRSRLRTKARYFLWLAAGQGGFAGRFPQAKSFLWPVSEGHLRLYHGVLKPKARRSFASPEARLQWFADLGASLFPEQGWRIFLPFQSHLRPDSALSFACRKVQGGCRACALAPICPSSKQFLPGEPRA